MQLLRNNYDPFGTGLELTMTSQNWCWFSLEKNTRTYHF